jgi:hypothetical protein
VLFAFLLFAGIGSRCSSRLQAFAVDRPGRLITIIAIAIGACALLILWLLPWLFRHSMGLPDAAKIVVATGLIAPLAFFMGMPFPLGLARVDDARLIAWAWGINGCASVTAAVLATLLAIHLGFTAVVLIALLLYGAAAAASP